MNNNRRITLGLDFDGILPRCYDTPFSCRMGPAAFLSFLEVHTGTACISESFLERTAAFMGVIRERENTLVFFRDSWKTAPFAVAQTLLSYIDEWYLNGWNGTADGMAPASRLGELASLAAASEQRVAGCIGQRLNRVGEAIDSGIRVPLGMLELVDPIPSWPAAWQRVLSRLPCDSGAAAAVPAEPVTLQDKSIQIFTCDSPVSAARYIAHSGIGSGAKDAIIAETEAALLDDAFRTAGKPGTGPAGVPVSSISSASCRLLPQALALLKQNPPLDTVLEFLASPLCPLAPVGYFFAAAISKSAGRKGKSWDEAMEKARQNYTETGKNPDDIQVALEKWLPPTGSEGDTIGRTRVITVAENVSSFLLSLIQGKKQTDPFASERLASVRQSCLLLIRVLGLLGPSFDEIPWGIVEQFTELSLGQFNAPGHCRREAGSAQVFSSPAQLDGRVETLVWFCPAAQLPVQADIWNTAEKKQLEGNKCIFKSPVELNAVYTEKMRRALGLVDTRLVVFISTADRETSPLQVELSSPGPIETHKLPAIETDILDGTCDGTVSVPVRALPSFARWWKVSASIAPKDVIGDKWKASHSQFDLFINRPAQWVLKYEACIKEGAALSVPAESLYRGTCAHLMVERLFNAYKDSAIRLDDSTFAEWFDTALVTALEECAAPYLEKIRSAELTKYRKVLSESIRSLSSLLVSVSAKDIMPEVKLEGTIDGITVTGSADVFFDTPNHGTGLIDMKFSHQRDHYTSLLLRDADIQLILYAELLNQMKGRVPASAYWLFPLQRLVSRKGLPFPDPIPDIAAGLPHADRLSRLIRSIRWRNSLLSQGFIEAVCEETFNLTNEGTQPADIDPPVGAIPKAREKPKDSYDPYVTLYGWKENV